MKSEGEYQELFKQWNSQHLMNINCEGEKFRTFPVLMAWITGFNE